MLKALGSNGYCDLGDECGGRVFHHGEVVNFNEEEENYFCNECARSLERKYRMKFESQVYYETECEDD